MLLSEVELDRSASRPWIVNWVQTDKSRWWSLGRSARVWRARSEIFLKARSTDWMLGRVWSFRAARFLLLILWERERSTEVRAGNWWATAEKVLPRELKVSKRAESKGRSWEMLLQMER